MYSEIGDFDPNDEQDGVSQSKSRVSGSRLSVFSSTQKLNLDKKRQSLGPELSSKRSGQSLEPENSDGNEEISSLRSQLPERYLATAPVQELVEEEELVSARTQKEIKNQDDLATEFLEANQEYN